MKYQYTGLFIILFSIITSASELKIEDQSIDQLIKEVKQSKNDARRQAMNKLKLKLRSVNQETRQKVMLQLRKSFAAGHQNHFADQTMPSQKHSQTNIQQDRSPIIHQQTIQQHIPKRQPSTPQQPRHTTPQKPVKHTFPKIPQSPSGGHP